MLVVLVALVHDVTSGTTSRLLPALMLFLAVGLTGVFLTGDVFSFYVFFELTLISAYSLSAVGGERRVVGGALIFAVVNLLGSFIFLIAIAALYRATGTLEMTAVAERAAEIDPNAAILIAVSFFVAFGVKLGLFPFHFWLPAIYGSAPPAVAAVLAGAVANIGAYGLLRFGVGLLPREVELASAVLIALGSASIIYGAIQAVGRRDTREVLAYSAIGHAGYVIVAIGLGEPVAVAAAVLFTLVNALQKSLLFLAVDLRGPFVGGRVRRRCLQRRRRTPDGRVLRQGRALRGRHRRRQRRRGGAAVHRRRPDLHLPLPGLPARPLAAPRRRRGDRAGRPAARRRVRRAARARRRRVARAADRARGPGGRRSDGRRRAMTGRIVTVAALVAVWLLTLASSDPVDAVIGAVLAIAVVAGLRPPALRRSPGAAAPSPLARLAATPALLAVVLADVAAGTWDVALRVLGLRPLDRPGLVLIPIGERTEAGIAATGLLFGLSPGSAADRGRRRAPGDALAHHRRARSRRDPGPLRPLLRALPATGRAVIGNAVFYVALVWMTLLLGACVLLVARGSTVTQRIVALDLLRPRARRAARARRRRGPAVVRARRGARARAAVVHRDAGQRALRRGQRAVRAAGGGPAVVSDVLGTALVFVGLAVMTLGVVGVFRFPDVYTQLHASSKAAFFGVAALLVAATLGGDGTIIARVVLIIVLLGLTTPVAAHAIGQAAFHRREAMRSPDAVDES